MDSDLSKPSSARDPACVNDRTGSQGLIDRSVLIEESRLFGRGLMGEIMEKYLKSYQAQVEQIAEHANASQFKELETAAHRFASSVSCFYANPVVKAAGNLERMAQARGTEELDAALAHLKQLSELLAAELEQILSEIQD
jgi:HPt (histidine-containing phosphotransfer) domain-containing protein